VLGLPSQKEYDLERQVWAYRSATKKEFVQLKAASLLPPDLAYNDLQRWIDTHPRPVDRDQDDDGNLDPMPDRTDVEAVEAWLERNATTLHIGKGSGKTTTWLSEDVDRPSDAIAALDDEESIAGEQEQPTEP
jgi:hypothetical protein